MFMDHATANELDSLADRVTKSEGKERQAALRAYERAWAKVYRWRAHRMRSEHHPYRGDEELPVESFRDLVALGHEFTPSLLDPNPGGAPDRGDVELLEAIGFSDAAAAKNVRDWARKVTLAKAGWTLQETLTAARDRAPGTLTEDEWRRIVAAYERCCAYCGKRKRLQIEHVIPVSRYGSCTSLENIVPACRPCNVSKLDRLPDEWLSGAQLDEFWERWLRAYARMEGLVS